MVLEEGLDISSLPETLKEDFEKLNQLEGRYRVIGILMEAVDLEETSPRKGLPCGFCNVKVEAEKMKPVVDHYKPITMVTKVILSELSQISSFSIQFHHLSRKEYFSLNC